MQPTRVLGVFCDALGHCSQSEVEPRGDRVQRVRHVVSSAPSFEYRSTQPAGLRLDWSHQLALGRITAIGEDSQGRAWAVGVLDDGRQLPPGPLFYSPEIRGTSEDGVAIRDITLVALSLTAYPASVSLPAVRILNPDDPAPPALSKFAANLLEEARSYQRGRPLVLRESRWEADPLPVVRGRLVELRLPGVGHAPPGGRIEHSAAVGSVVAVR